MRSLPSLLFVVALSTVACVAAPTRSPTPTQPVGLALATFAVWPLPSNSACAGVGLGPLPFTLEGSPSEGVYGLLGSGKKIQTIWPPGYIAQFTPLLVVLDPNGRVVARAGLNLDIDEPLGLVPCVGPDMIAMVPA